MRRGGRHPEKATAARSAASMRSCDGASTLRTVPATAASAGSTLWLLPLFTRVTDNTADSAGSMRRETMVLSWQVRYVDLYGDPLASRGDLDD